jgi:hypothetical protein
MQHPVPLRVWWSKLDLYVADLTGRYHFALKVISHLLRKPAQVGNVRAITPCDRCPRVPRVDQVLPKLQPYGNHDLCNWGFKLGSCAGIVLFRGTISEPQFGGVSDRLP